MTAETIKARLVGIKAAAKYLGICERKLWELSKQNRIRTVRIDRCLRFDVADLDSFITEAKGTGFSAVESTNSGERVSGRGVIE